MKDVTIALVPSYIFTLMLLKGASVDMSNNFPFREDEWIATGKKYTADVPFEVSNAKSEQLCIPDSYKNKLPSPESSVSQFLKFKHLTHSNDLISAKINVWFNNDKPITNPACLFTHSIPPKKILHRLHDAFGQAWLDGAKSISEFSETVKYLNWIFCPWPT